MALTTSEAVEDQDEGENRAGSPRRFWILAGGLVAGLAVIGVVAVVVNDGDGLDPSPVAPPVSTTALRPAEPATVDTAVVADSTPVPATSATTITPVTTAATTTVPPTTVPPTSVPPTTVPPTTVPPTSVPVATTVAPAAPTTVPPPGAPPTTAAPSGGFVLPDQPKTSVDPFVTLPP